MDPMDPSGRPAAAAGGLLTVLLPSASGKDTQALPWRWRLAQQYAVPHRPMTTQDSPTQTSQPWPVLARRSCASAVTEVSNSASIVPVTKTRTPSSRSAGIGACTKNLSLAESMGCPGCGDMVTG